MEDAYSCNLGCGLKSCYQTKFFFKKIVVAICLFFKEFIWKKILWICFLMQMMCGFFSLNCNALDEVGSRIDELEQSINDLKAEMGVEGSPSPLPPAKAKSEETKPAEGST